MRRKEILKSIRRLKRMIKDKRANTTVMLSIDDINRGGYLPEEIAARYLRRKNILSDVLRRDHGYIIIIL